jgi:hypothetical protein
MSQRDKLLVKILLIASDANIPFDLLCQLLRTLGFDERIRGSHHIFSQEVLLIVNPEEDNNFNFAH